MNIEPKSKAAWIGISAALIACWLMAGARPVQALPVGCTQSADLEVGLNSSAPVAVVSFPISLSATTPTIVIQSSGPPSCEGAERISSEVWKWTLDAPPGSHSQLANVDTLDVTFNPDKPGKYTVNFNGCGNQCTMKLVTKFVNGKAVTGDVRISNPVRQMVFNVAETAQVPPRLVPPPGPSPAGQLATDPQHFGSSQSFCGNKKLLALGFNAEWFTTSPTPNFELVEGRVYDSIVSRIDTPRGHIDNDADVKVDVDPWLRRLLMDDNASDKGSAGLPFGGMEVEWEWPQWAEGFRPLVGDRISALGYHVIDCGHAINTELHPPIAVAVHRPLPVKLPDFVSLENGKPVVHIGSNIYVPGIITDIFVNLNGADILNCVGDSLRQSTSDSPPCVPQPDQPGIPFAFNVYLPVNPQRIVKSVMHNDPPVPALFRQFVDPPEAPGGLISDIQFQIIDDTHLDSDIPYFTVSVDISKMRTGQMASKRLISAWVYPDITGKNYGLRALRLRLDQLQVTDTGDIRSGDWKLWLGYRNAVRPWTRLINCEDCVDQKTYSFADSIFESGALGTGGLLKGEILEFRNFSPFSLGRLRLTGYEQDTFGGDDVGEVDAFVGGPGQFVLQSFCEDQAQGSINPADSGCAGYIAHIIVEPGQTPVSSVLDPQTKKFLNSLLVGKPSLSIIDTVSDSQLYAGKVTARIARLTSRREVEAERWQDAFKPGRLSAVITRSQDPDLYVKSLRQRVVHVLGTNPTPKYRAKVRADLLKVKPSIPPALYQKHLCDLETGQACAAKP
jgi:hypothetical protein